MCRQVVMRAADRSAALGVSPLGICHFFKPFSVPGRFHAGNDVSAGLVLPAKIVRLAAAAPIGAVMRPIGKQS